MKNNKLAPSPMNKNQSQPLKVSDYRGLAALSHTRATNSLLRAAQVAGGAPGPLSEEQFPLADMGLYMGAQNAQKNYGRSHPEVRHILSNYMGEFNKNSPVQRSTLANDVNALRGMYEDDAKFRAYEKRVKGTYAANKAAYGLATTPADVAVLNMGNTPMHPKLLSRRSFPTYINNAVTLNRGEPNKKIGLFVSYTGNPPTKLKNDPDLNTINNAEFTVLHEMGHMSPFNPYRPKKLQNGPRYGALTRLKNKEEKAYGASADSFIDESNNLGNSPIFEFGIGRYPDETYANLNALKTMLLTHPTAALSYKQLWGPLLSSQWSYTHPYINRFLARGQDLLQALNNVALKNKLQPRLQQLHRDIKAGRAAIPDPRVIRRSLPYRFNHAIGPNPERDVINNINALKNTYNYMLYPYSQIP